MISRRIVYTNPNGGVSVCAPSLTALTYMTNGGGRWDGFPRGFIDRQIAEQAKYGVGEWAASRFVRAMQFGGCSTSDAYAIMRDRFCAHLGTGCELWDVSEVPLDRWFRDAWRRSHNGGPILVDMKAAKAVQWLRLTHAAKTIGTELKPRLWRERIRKADSPEALRHVWFTHHFSKCKLDI